MDLRQLRYFVGIVQAGSLSRAADQLHVAQSAISHHLASLESELGRQLVTRGPKGILLTEAGGVLYRHAEAILRHVEFAKQDALNVLSVPSGRVSIGFPVALASLLAIRTVRADPQRLSADPAASRRWQQRAVARTAEQWPSRHRRAAHRATRARPCGRTAGARGTVLCDGRPRSFARPHCRCGTTSAAGARSRQRHPARRPEGVRETRAAARADRRMRFIEYDARAGRIRRRQLDHDMVRTAQWRSAT